MTHEDGATSRFNVIFCHSIEAIHAIYNLTLEVSDSFVTLRLIFNFSKDKVCQVNIIVIISLFKRLFNNFNNWFRRDRLRDG